MCLHLLTLTLTLTLTFTRTHRIYPSTHAAQAVVLRADKDGTFRTMDNAVLGKFGQKFVQEVRL